MDQMTIAWGLFLVYLAGTVVLALKGMKQTTDFRSFALGKRDMGPLLVGVTLATSIASSATFVINPGFVYQHGLAAFLHFAVASPIGVILALVLFSKGFRRIGDKVRAVTLPQWIQQRYNHRGMGTYFAILNLLLSVSFVVLIIKGSALVMQFTLGLGYVTSLALIVGVVFSYIFLGGTYAHAYTNSFQGLFMIAVAILIVGSGLHYFSDGIGAFFDQIAAIDPNLAKPLNPASALFGDIWDVGICVFIISMGLVCQPHILMKSMYLKNDKDVNRYLIVGSVVSLIFATLLIAGFYARLSLPGDIAQDAVMARYISQSFSPALGAFVSVALLAAGMSTLDGILVNASTIAANDVFLNLSRSGRLARMSTDEREALALKLSRYFLVGMGTAAFLIALNPPQLVGIFAQTGIYGLTAASLAPIAGGIYFPKLNARHVFIASVLGPAVHFSLFFYRTYWIGVPLNPAVSGALGIVISFMALGLLSWLRPAAGHEPSAATRSESTLTAPADHRTA